MLFRIVEADRLQFGKDRADEDLRFNAKQQSLGIIRHPDRGATKFPVRLQLAMLANPLEPQITIPADAQEIVIGSDGTVSVTQAGQATAQQVGTIQIANFQNPGGLSGIGRNLLVPTSASGTATTATPSPTTPGPSQLRMGDTRYPSP